MKSVGIAIVAMVLTVLGASSGELVQNGDFESGMSNWSYVAEGDAKGSARLVTDRPLSKDGPHSLRLEAIDLGTRCGISNQGGAGMNIAQDTWYEVTFYARNEGERGIGLVFSLETADGKKVCARTTLPEIGRPVEGNDQWRQYTVSLHAYASDPKCRLVISPIEPGTLYFDNISLQPRAASEGAKP